MKQEDIEKLKKVAKEILNANPGSYLVGSLMLHLRGFTLDRDIGDIDIIIPGEQEPTIPESFHIVHRAKSGYFFLQLSNNIEEIDGIRIVHKVDLIRSEESECKLIEEIDGIRVGSIAGLIYTKIEYLKHSSKKHDVHIKDLKNLINFYECDINVADDILMYLLDCIDGIYKKD